MKRFILFAGCEYYPSGGAYDYIDSFDSIEDVKCCAELLKDDIGFDWAHLMDTETGNIHEIDLETFEVADGESIENFSSNI